MQTATEKRVRSVGYYLQRFSSAMFLVIMIIVASLLNDNFFEVSNFLNISKQIAILGVMALAQTFVILTGGIDLSVGSVVSFTGCLMVLLVEKFAFPPMIAILLGILSGVLCGFISGVVIVKGKIPPFIATLGMTSVVAGAAQLITNGRLIMSTSSTLNYLGGAKVIGGIPLSPIIWIIVSILAWVVLKHTVFGRNIYALGGNEEASRRSGIRVGLSLILVYTISGLICGVAGLLTVGRLKSASGLMAAEYQLNTVAATCLGGASLTGGKGNISGTIIGVLTIGILNNCLNLLNISTFVQEIVLGAMIVTVVIFDTYRNRKLNS